MFEQVFNDVGYRLESDFFESDFARRLIVPFGRKQLVAETVTVDDSFLFRVSPDPGGIATDPDGPAQGFNTQTDTTLYGNRIPMTANETPTDDPETFDNGGNYDDT